MEVASSSKQESIAIDAATSARLERIATNRAGLWWALALQLLGLLLFVLFCNFIAPSLGENLDDRGRVALGFALSLIPAILWLSVFYGFDRIEPEPKQMVIVTFVAGALLFGALHQPVLQGLFQINQWLFNSDWSRLLGGVLVVGIFEMYLVFLAVRYVAFESPEFDERVDGVIYAVAAGLGVATVINFLYVADRGGVDMGIGSLRMVINTLAYASFSGMLGFFIGQAKFERTPIWYLPAGLSVAALMNGVLFTLLERGSDSLHAGLPWSDLLLAALVALIALLLVFSLIARANEETLRIAHGEAAPAAPRAHGEGQPSRPFGGLFGAQPVAASLAEPSPTKPPEKGAPPPPTTDQPADKTAGESTSTASTGTTSTDTQQEARHE